MRVAISPGMGGVRDRGGAASRRPCLPAMAKPRAEGRDKKGRFKPGTSGNPSGTPTGSRNRATLIAQELLDGEAEKLTRKCIDLALEGNPMALKLCVERLSPPRRERSVNLSLPKIVGLEDHPAALGEVARAAAAGEVTPAEAAALSGVLEIHRRSLESADLAQRLAQVEEALNSAHR